MPALLLAIQKIVLSTNSATKVVYYYNNTNNFQQNPNTLCEKSYDSIAFQEKALHINTQHYYTNPINTRTSISIIIV